MKIFNKVLVAVILFTGLTSCLKDEMISNQKYGIINANAYKIIEMTAPLTDLRNVAVDIKTDPQTVDFATVHLAAESPATEDIKVTLSVANSQQIIDKYNSADADNDGELDHTPLVLLPPDQYTFPNGLDVTIPKGSKDAKLKLTVNNSSLLDPSTVYGIVVEINSIDKAGYTISGNFKYEIISFAVKNQYDGIYDFKGYILRNSVNGPDPALSGNFKDEEATLTTLNVNAVQFKQIWANSGPVGGIDGLTLTVDPATNAVTCSSSANATLMNDPNYNNHYDPATKTFYVSFKWGTFPNNRAATDTLTFNRPR
jgi:hypothetical protein